MQNIDSTYGNDILAVHELSFSLNKFSFSYIFGKTKKIRIIIGHWMSKLQSFNVLTLTFSLLN